MKRLFIVLLSVAGLAVHSLAGNYEETMKREITGLYEAIGNKDRLTAIANTFQRIAQKETGEWLPRYYAAYAYVSVLFVASDMSADQRTGHLDRAQKELDQALKLKNNESEIHVLQALVYQMRISDQASAMKYSALAGESLAEAERLDPANPRVWYLKGTNLFYRPEAFGGGARVAAPHFKKAATLFDNEAKTQTGLMPSWGSQPNKHMLEQCGVN